MEFLDGRPPLHGRMLATAAEYRLNITGRRPPTIP